MKTHVIETYKPWYKPAYVANGLIGVRAGENPLWDKQVLEAGFCGLSEQHGVEAYAPLPAPQLDLYIESDCLSEVPYHYHFVRQAYDFSCGELITDFTYENHEGKSVQGKHILFCSRSMPTLIMEKVIVTAGDDLAFSLAARLDLRSLPLRQLLSLKPNVDADMVILAEGRGGKETAGIALLMTPTGEKWTKAANIGLFEQWGYENEFRIQAWQISLKRGETAGITIATSYVPSCMHTEPHWQAVRMIKMATWYGYEAIREANRKCWEEIWHGRITVEGAQEKWQDCLDASYFYLYSSMHTSAPYGIAPFGLGDRFCYKGHVFWDCESFMFLLPLLSDPHIAKSLLEYRFERLEAARNNARLNGFRGIQFPWQSGSSGCEVTRVSAGQAGGAGEQHVNMDVAMAFAAYAYVSGDEIFLRQRAWPVLQGVSEWIESRVTKTARGYEILHVCGIDEDRDNVDNDGYTNVMAARVLRETNHIAEKLGYARIPLWDEIAQQLVIPLLMPEGILTQFEGVKETPRMSMAPLMAYFPYKYTNGMEADANTYRYYIEHDLWYYLSYPMLSGFLGVFPAFLGDREASLRFFEQGNLDFFCDPFMQCSQQGRSEKAFGNPDNRRTLFLTGRGSFLAAMMMGLPKLNIWQDDPEKWCSGPIVLPQGWTKIEVGRVWVHGKKARIIARHGAEKAEIEYLDK